MEGKSLMSHREKSRCYFTLLGSPWLQQIAMGAKGQIKGPTSRLCSIQWLTEADDWEASKSRGEGECAKYKKERRPHKMEFPALPDMILEYPLSFFFLHAPETVTD